jgi:hypothetical protein
VTGDPTQMRELTREVAGADDPRIMRIVATVDALMLRGPADHLIAPLRRRLATLRPPHPLRFARLLFHPLDRLIVAPARWRPGQQAIPRTALMPMADHVRLAMGTNATAIEAEIAGRTTADTELIVRLGRSLWPAAAVVLMDDAVPATWNTTELGDAGFRTLASIIAALLAEAPTLDALSADTATGLLPPAAAPVAALLGRVAKMHPPALPMMITLLLDRLPAAAGLFPQAHEGQDAAAIHAAMDLATDLLLGQLDQPTGGTETRIASGTLADAGAATNRIATLLANLEAPGTKPKRRDRLRAIRQRLDAGCKARFADGLQDELLAPLQQGARLTPAAITDLETTARGLRVLETEARVVGSGPTYDLLLTEAAEAIQSSAVGNRLTLADQLRLVEVLKGSDAALAMLDQPS